MELSQLDWNWGWNWKKRSGRRRDVLIKLDFAKERSSLDLTCSFGKSWSSWICGSWMLVWILSVSNYCSSDSFALRSLTVCTLELQVEIAKQTAVNWASFCREVIYDALILNKQKLGGPGVEVEIDESKFGRRKYYKGYWVEDQWVFGMFERGTGRVVMIPVEKRFVLF